MKRLISKAVLVLLIASPAGAQKGGGYPPALTHKLQCFMALGAMANSSNPTVKNAGIMGSLFFAGEVFGAQPGINLTAAVRHEIGGMTATRIAQLQRECGREMQGRGQQITAAGSALERSVR